MPLDIPLHQAECHTAKYYTTDGLCEFGFIYKRSAGAARWHVQVSYGDERITTYPKEFYELGLLFPGKTEVELKLELATWAENVWKQFNPDKRPSLPPSAVGER